MDHEESLVVYNPVVKEMRYLNILECGENILNRLGTTCKQVCMADSRYKYYTELLRAITHFNNPNNAPLTNENIREVINKVIAEEELDAHNVTAGTFIQMSNTQGDNANTILKSEKLDK